MNKRRGYALIIVIVLLSILTIYAYSNRLAIRQLGDYLQALEKKQQLKFSK